MILYAQNEEFGCEGLFDLVDPHGKKWGLLMVRVGEYGAIYAVAIPALDKLRKRTDFPD